MYHKLIEHNEQVKIEKKLNCLMKKFKEHDVVLSNGLITEGVMTTAYLEGKYFALYYGKGIYHRISAHQVDANDELEEERSFGFSEFLIQKYNFGEGLSDRKNSVQPELINHLGVDLERRKHGIGSLLFLAKCFIESLYDLDKIVIFDSLTTIPYRYGFSPEKYYKEDAALERKIPYIKRDNYTAEEIWGYLMKFQIRYPELSFLLFREFAVEC